MHQKDKNLFTFLKYGLKGLRDLFLLPIFYLPGPLGFTLRYSYYKRRLKYMGKNVQIDTGVSIQNPQNISIGDNTWIDKYVLLMAGPPAGNRETLAKENKDFKLNEGDLFVGKNVHIAPFSIVSAIGGVYIGNDVAFSSGCKVYSFTHHYRSFADPSDETVAFGSQVPQERQAMICGPIVIDDNVALAYCTVLPGVSIHKNSFITTNSVVSCNIPENSIASGNPAAVIKNRFEDTKHE